MLYEWPRLGKTLGLRPNGSPHHISYLLLGTVEVAEIMGEVETSSPVGAPKTRAGRRLVGLPRRVVGELEHHLDGYVANDPDAFDFTAPQG
jgi:hypothetical protein